MNLPHVLSCGAFRAAQIHRGTVSSQWICFMISGLKYGRNFAPDGTRLEDTPCTPHLGLAYPQFVNEFKYDETRENFVLFFEYDAFRYDAVQHRMYLQNGERREYLKNFCRIAPEDVMPMRDLFMRITRLAASGFSSDNLRADILAAGFFAYFLKEELPPDSPAVILKKRIDDDRTYRFCLQEHANAIGMSLDHLRREFKAQFGIGPGEYRERRRRNDLLSRITFTNHPFKEVAASLGLKHVQHLNLLTQKYFQCTPKELAAKYRRQIPYVTPSDLENITKV